MKTFELKGEIREDFGRKAARTYRSEGLVPCVLYGGKDENVNFVVKQNDIRNLIYTPEVFLVNIDLGGKKYMSILQDAQFHPVKDDAMHLDFLHVFDDVPVVIDIPVSLQGLAAGVKAGGKLSLDIRKLRVKALAKDLPERLDIDVTKLTLGKSIQVGQLKFEGLELLNAKDAVICRVQLTRAARGDASRDVESEEHDEEHEGEHEEGHESSSEE